MHKIGILSGTFDPVHSGHIGLALEALQVAGLDKVYLLPEARPRGKDGVTHYAHRLAMLKLALKPYPKIGLLEVADKQFTITKTLPKIKKQLPKDVALAFIIGSDVLDGLSSGHWPASELLLAQVTLVCGVRIGKEVTDAQKLMDGLQEGGIVFASHRPHASSRDIRQALLLGKKHKDLLPSLESYIKQHWLYSSPAAAEAPNIS